MKNCVLLKKPGRTKCVHQSNPTHVEKVVLLSQQKMDDRIEVDLDEFDVTLAEMKATY